jgi:preflagellin peptidase FlaK
VPNELWLLMVLLGLPLAGYQVVRNGIPYLAHYLLALLGTALLAYLFFRLHLFGGADAKGLIAIAVLFPTHPLGARVVLDPFPFAITTLFNGAIVSAVVLPLVFFSLFVYNRVYGNPEEITKDRGLAFIGYQLPISTLPSVNCSRIRLLHSFEDEGADGITRRFILGGLEIDEERIEALTRYHEEGKIGEYVWVTPGLPYMLFITAGFFIALFYGNLIFELMGLFLAL